MSSTAGGDLGSSRKSFILPDNTRPPPPLPPRYYSHLYPYGTDILGALLVSRQANGASEPRQEMERS